MTTTSRLFQSKLARYVISGGTGAAINLSLTWLLGRTALHYIAVVSIAFAVSVVASFALQKFFTFRDAELSRARGQFALFLAVSLANLFINDFLVYLQHDVLRVPYLVLEEAVASAVIAVYSFFVYRALFQDKGNRTSAPAPSSVPS